MDPLKILFVSSEVAPFSKTGGLGDVSGALPRYLHDAGHDVRLFTPLYSKIDPKGRDFQPEPALRGIPVRLGSRTYRFNVYTAPLASGLRVHFIDCPALYHRPGIYTQDRDEHLRFALLTHAALASCQHLGWSPGIAHANDWHTALLPFYLKYVYGWDRLFERTRSVLTIHNVAYQGIFPSSILPDVSLGDRPDLLYQEDLAAGIFGFLKTGLLYADAITTVSRTYAREIQTPEFGRGLDSILRARADHVFGIVNGVDYAAWDPATDPHLPHSYSMKNLGPKEENKKVLCEELGLNFRPDAPLIGIVSRLTAQKGFELLDGVAQQMLQWRDVRMAVLGSGEAGLEEFFQRLASDNPGRVCFYRGYNEPLAHMIESGADTFLMPSQFEPCGLNQMYSLRYGTPPIVRRTGGLADTVSLWNPEKREGTGFVFDHFSADALRWAITYALDSWQDRSGWKTLMRNGMAQDWSWQKQVREYEQLYSRLV